MQPNITIVDGYKLRIAGFECGELGYVSQKTIDMTPYAGQYVRIWLDKDGTYSLNPRKDHFWQVAEFQAPEQEYKDVDTGETDPDTGEPVIVTEAVPLDMSAVEIEKWQLPG